MAKTIRIQKYLGDGGILSRRKTEEYIKAGQIGRASCRERV